MAYLFGYDIGSSSIKAALLDADSGTLVASATSPKQEMEIMAPRPGWAEQHPETWWQHLCAATAEIRQKANFDPADVKAIGISYQMHGLVTVDKDGKALRPAIIWCDSRAVGAGEQAEKAIGREKCFDRLLNLPGNFTASKLKWVKENEPEIYAKIHKILLPGDYAAFRMTGEMKTTFSGLSEGMFWDFKADATAGFLLDAYGFDPALLAEAVPTFSHQGALTAAAAAELGLKAGTPVCYRAGDQPNNALSLNVLNPGEAACTAGTSGVVYGIIGDARSDTHSRVNVFVHVNHKHSDPRFGVLLCANGTGILNSWLKRNVAGNLSYDQMNEAAMKAPAGSDGLIVLPYGNGAERTLVNRNPGASVHNWNFNTHTQAHLLRAAQEGIVFALNYGMDIMRGMGMHINTLRAGHANMFLSPVFSEAFATVTGATVELFNTDGAQGAARGAGIGSGLFSSAAGAFHGLDPVKTVSPNPALAGAYADAYGRWEQALQGILDK